MKNVSVQLLYGLLFCCLFTGNIASANVDAVPADSAVNQAANANSADEADVIVLSREQAVKIMKVLEQVVESYSKDGSLDLVGDGARAALSCCGQLDELIVCVLAIKAKIDALTIQVSTGDELIITTIGDLSSQVSADDAQLLTKIALVQSCCDAVSTQVTNLQSSVNTQFIAVNANIDAFEAATSVNFNTVNTNISNAVTNLSSQDDVLCTKILNLQANVDTRIDNLSIQLSNVQIDLSTKLDQVLLCTCA